MSSAAQKNEDQQPLHHSGHRARLRGRFVEHGAQTLQDYELIELLLFAAIPRKDVKPLAKDLLNHFGSIANILNASYNALCDVKGISENTATTILTVRALAERIMRQDLSERPILNNWTRLIDYCHTTMAHETKESLRIFFLNKKNELIADEVQSTGTVDQTPAYPREIMKRSLELGATALILVHNHPSGERKASQADIDITRQIIAAAKPFEINIHDHLIITQNGHTSLRSEGLI